MVAVYVMEIIHHVLTVQEMQMALLQPMNVVLVMLTLLMIVCKIVQVHGVVVL